jgi:hypothetical protein
MTASLKPNEREFFYSPGPFPDPGHGVYLSSPLLIMQLCCQLSGVWFSLYRALTGIFFFLSKVSAFAHEHLLSDDHI